MKIAIGYRLHDGPWGGGNSVMHSLAELLPTHGCDVVWSLEDDDIDIIMLIGTRLRSSRTSFTAGAVLRYLVCRNPRAIVVQRINDVDERKGTRTVNLRQRLTSYAADHVVVVGSWMKDLNIMRREHRNSCSVILGGGRTKIFHRRGHRKWDGKRPLRLVTHHWSNNLMKGFDVYTAFDRLLDSADWAEQFEFTYIGNVASDLEFRNTRVLPPLAADALSDELRKHHVYLTASINEPSGQHHIEGALCGLPIIYRRSGALPEYCDGFGIGFNCALDFADAIRRMQAEYRRWYEALDRYERTDIRMVSGYVELFSRLVDARDSIVSRRSIWRNPAIFAVNQILI